MQEPVKTGEVYSRDEDGVLWLFESFIDAAGTVTTNRTKIEEAPQE